VNLTRNGLIVLISIIFVAGAGTAYAGIVLPLITLAGDVTITGDTTLQGDLVCTNCIDAQDLPEFLILEEINIIDQRDIVGSNSDIALTPDGLPVISYYDFTNKDVKFVKCGNTTCTADNVFTTIDSAGNVGTWSSIAFRSDDIPVISYYDVTNSDLKLVFCGNVTCTASNSIITVRNVGLIGTQTSLALDSQGRAVIVYRDVTNGRIIMDICTNSSCSSFLANKAFGVGGAIDPHLAMSSGDIPVISFYSITDQALTLVRCGDPLCSGFTNEQNILDTNAHQSSLSSLALASGDIPVMSYFTKSPNFDLRLIRCGNPACSSGNTINIIDTGQVGRTSSVEITSDDKPIISYYDQTNDDLKLAICSDITCSSKTITTVDSGFLVGQWNSLVLSSDDIPIISYDDAFYGDLKLKGFTKHKILG